MAYQPKPFEIAGFDLFGERQADGTIKFGSAPVGLPDDRTHMLDFPDRVEVCGATYTLETVRLNRVECSIKDPKHPGYIIEWGVYV